MKVLSTTTPASDVGAHITNSIASHKGDTVVLLSGGSALEVFNSIKVTNKSKCRTIFMMIDERVSGEETINNYLQLKARYGYLEHFSSVIDTSAEDKESEINFAERIRKIFTKAINTLSNVQIITLLGMGTDGHTAGIFPLPEEQFTKTYEADPNYVPVHLESLTIDSRASFTPNWILEHSTEIIGMIAGEAKETILNQLINESKPIHEQPAQILKIHSNCTVYTDLHV